MWAPHQREISHCSDGPTTLDHHLVDAGASHLIPWAGRIISFSRKAAAASAASAARLSASRTTTDWRNARFFFFFAAAAQPKKWRSFLETSWWCHLLATGILLVCRPIFLLFCCDVRPPIDIYRPPHEPRDPQSRRLISVPQMIFIFLKNQPLHTSIKVGYLSRILKLISRLS